MHTRSWEVLHTSIKMAGGGQIATFILNGCGLNFQDPPLWEWASNFWSSMGEGFNSKKDNVCQSLALTLASVSCMFSSQSCSGEETKTIPSWDEPGE